ncbi:MAG: WYL domain-containing transcriptional regulator [Ruminococcus sp.]|nr:WYL domain-containing transcriptional regulator [Ruminococcus sp.]
MAGFSELIKNFDKTRDYVRDFFIYGCKVRSDFNRKSSRTYDDEKRRVESWIGDYMRYDDSVRGRQVSISVDSGHIPENPLYSAFYSRSFTDNDIRLHFLLLDILSQEERLTLRRITDLLESEYGFFFEEQTVRNKLREYTGEGIVIAEKQGKSMVYSLTPDRADEYLASLPGLEDAVKFFSEVQSFGVVGNSILKSLGLKNDLFFIKHNYIIHTLEDLLLPELLRAIDQERYVTVTVFPGRRDRDHSGEEKERLLLPMQIFSSAQTGRRYAAGYAPDLRRFTAMRLDNIKSVRAGEVCTDWRTLKKSFDKAAGRCFGVSFGTSKEDSGRSPMKIEFFADPIAEHYVIERLEREKRCCTLERTGDHIYTLTTDVHDANEIMHWIKTFIGRIKRIEGGPDSVRARFYSDIYRMDKMYGGDEDEHIQ